MNVFDPLEPSPLPDPVDLSRELLGAVGSMAQRAATDSLRLEPGVSWEEDEPLSVTVRRAWWDHFRVCTSPLIPTGRSYSGDDETAEWCPCQNDVWRRTAMAELCECVKLAGGRPWRLWHLRRPGIWRRPVWKRPSRLYGAR